MKIYILDDSENCYDEAGLLRYKVITSIVHFESSDGNRDKQDLSAEQIEWTQDKLLLELTQGDKVISGIPGVELRRGAVYPDGRSCRLETLSLDVTALYALYLHLKKIDEVNPDNVMW